VSDEPIFSRHEGTAYDDDVLDRSRVVRRFRRLFNALNYFGRRGADSTDWADEPGEWSLLSGEEGTGRTKTMTLPR
jgi:hypothetical protein